MFFSSLHLPPPPESWMGQGQTALQALHCRTRHHPAVIKTSGPSINLIVVIVCVYWYHVSIYGNPVSCFEGELQVWVWVGRVFLGNIVIHCHHFLRGRRGGREEGRGKGGEVERRVKHMVLVGISSSPYLAGSRQDHVGAVHCPPQGL